MSTYPHVKFLTSAAEAHQLAPDEGREIAFAGRSNSGKSTAINAIAQRAGLARVSRTPGRTQLINFFELSPQRRLVDLPGYGFAKVPERVLARDRFAHVLLTKADKLNRRDAQRVLRETMAACSDTSVTAQLFSAHDSLGFEEARQVMDRWLQSP